MMAHDKADDLTAERAAKFLKQHFTELLRDDGETWFGDVELIQDLIKTTRHAALREAASRIDIDHVGGLLDAPCLWCGYNGERYWQMGTHAKECLWYGAEGRLPRICKLGRLASEGA